MTLWCKSLKVFKGLWEKDRFCSNWITTSSPGEIEIIIPSSVDLQPSRRDLVSGVSKGKISPSPKWTLETLASVFIIKLPGTFQVESEFIGNSRLIV